MDDKFQGKGKIEDVRTELLDENHIQRRPKNFSLERRSDVYYFSDNSARGILKRVPIKNGSYKLNELETVLEKSISGKSQNEIWSDVPLNDTGSSKVNKNNTADQNNYLCESVHPDHNEKTVLKSLNETTRKKLQSLNLKKEANKDYSKSRIDDKKPRKFIDQDQNADSFNKQLTGLRKKSLSPNASTYFKELKISVSDERHEKLSASNAVITSSKEIEARKFDNESLSETWTESSLTDALNMMSRKTPLTEL